MRYENAELKATATKAVVPPTVKIGTTTYKVTAIAPKAFMGYSKLRTVTVGYNVGVLRPGAFAEAASLKKLNIQTSQLTMKKTKKALQNSVVEATKLSDYKAIFAKAHSGSAKKVTVDANGTNGTASASNETDTTTGSTSANNNQKQDSTTTGNTTNSSNQQQSTTSNTTSDASDDNSSQQDTASDASDSNDQDAASNTSDSSSQ